MRLISFIAALLLISSAMIVTIPREAEAALTEYTYVDCDSLTGWTSVHGTPSITTSPGYYYNGTGGIRLADSGVRESALRTGMSGWPASGINVSFWFKADTAKVPGDAAGYGNSLVGLQDEGGAYHGPILYNGCETGLGGGSLDIYYLYSGSYYDTGYDITLDAWMFIELSVYDDYDHFKMRVNNGTWSSELDCIEQSSNTPSAIYMSADGGSGEDLDDFYYDAFMFTTGGEEEVIESPLEAFTTYPLINAENGIAYWYDSAASNATSYSLDTDADWLSIEEETGNVSGTPDSTGTFWVNVTASNGTAFVSQNYTMIVQEGPLWSGINDEGGRGYGTSWVYHDRLYYAYEGYDLDPYIKYYNASTSTWSSPVKVGENPLDNDGHGTPYICIDHSGYIHVTYGTHGADGNGLQQYKRSTDPNDISSWTDLSDRAGMSDMSTYGNILNYWDEGSETETLSLFYRNDEGEDFDTWFVKSTDGGSTWGGATEIIASSSRAVYSSIPVRANLSAFENEVWMISYTIYLGSFPGGQNGNISMVIFNPEDSHLYTMGGLDLGTSVDDSDLPTLKINPYVGPDTHAEYFDCQDARPAEIDGIPYQGYTTGNDTGTETLGNFQYVVAYFDYGGTDSWEILPYFGSTVLRNDQVAIINVTAETVTACVSNHANISDLYNNNSVQIWEYDIAGETWSCVGEVKTNQQPRHINAWDYLSFTTFGPYTNCNKFVQILEQGTEMSSYYSYIYDALNHEYLVNGTDITDIFEAEYLDRSWDPSFSSSARTTALVNRAYTYQVRCNESVTFTISTSATWMSISGSGLLTGTPTRTGSYSVWIRADNENNGTSWQNFTITVSLPSDPGGGGGGGGDTTGSDSPRYWLWAGAGFIALLLLTLLLSAMGGRKGKNGGASTKRRR